MSRFELIVPTHERHEYLKRSMHYYTKLDAHVHYCDSSATAYPGPFPSNVIYHHLPRRLFADKVLHAISAADSRAVALCADDDFIFHDSLEEGCAILSSSDKFKLVTGRFIGFRTPFDGKFFPLYGNRMHKDITGGGRANVHAFMRDFFMVLWAMYDRETIRHAFEIIERAKFNNDNFFEFTVACICLSAGGAKFLESIWGAREVNTVGHWGARHRPISHFMFDRKIREDIRTASRFIDAVTFPGCTKEAFARYLGWHLRLSAKGIVYRTYSKIRGLGSWETSAASGAAVGLEGMEGLDRIREALSR